MKRVVQKKKQQLLPLQLAFLSLIMIQQLKVTVEVITTFD